MVNYDNAAKLATTSTGIDVTGSVDASLDLLVGGAVAGNAGTRTINVGTAGSVAGGVQIWAGTTQTSFLQFGDDSSISANHYRGYLSYNHSTDTLALGAAGSTKVSVTSTGIDVTGTVTADGLTVDGDVSISDSVPILRLDSPAVTWSGGEDLGGIDWYTEDTSGNGPAVMARIYSESSGTNTLPIPNMIFQTSVADVALKDRMRIDGTGDISFYEDTGTTAKLFWDASAESLGIGTSSVALAGGGGGIHVNHASIPEIKLTNSTTGSGAGDGTAFKRQ
jgi:hypothetical protein